MEVQNTCQYISKYTSALPQKTAKSGPWSPGSSPDVLRARVRDRVHALVLGAPQEPALCLHLDQGQSKPGVSERPLVWSSLKARRVLAESNIEYMACK